MKRLGEWFKEEREMKGLSLEEVSKALRIRPHYLEAMEEGRFDELPPQVIAKGFIRAYARHLGLDEEEAIRLYQEEVNKGESPPLPPQKEGREVAPLVVALLTVAFLSLFLLWVKGGAIP